MRAQAEAFSRPHSQETGIIPFGATPEQQKQVIHTHINAARDSLLNRPRDVEKSQLTYDLAMNMTLYGALKKFENPNSTAYLEVKKQLDAQTKFDVETMLGERCNVLLSSYTVDVTPAGLVPRGYAESFLTIIKRGQENREKQGSNAVDREKAEVIGAEKMQQIFCDPNTPIGTMVLSFSPPREGTIYNKRFHDIATLKLDENGKRCVEIRRYSSSLDKKEYAAILHRLDPSRPYVIPTDVALLSNPIQKRPDNTITNADDLHKMLHKDHGYTAREDFEQAIEACEPFAHAFLQYLAEFPYDWDGNAERLDVTTIKFDQELKDIRGEKKALEKGVVYVREDNTIRYLPLQQQYQHYKKLEVETIMTGCGISGGSRTRISKDGLSVIGEVANSPFGVAAFGVKKELLLQKPEEEYGFDDFEPCVGHIMKFDDHSRRYVGPCDLCKSCDEEAKKGRLKKPDKNTVV